MHVLKVIYNDAIKECLMRKMELMSLETISEAKCITQGLNKAANAKSKSISRENDIGKQIKLITTYFIKHFLGLVWTSGKKSCESVAWCSTNRTSKAALLLKKKKRGSSPNCVAFNSKQGQLSLEDCDKPQRFMCEVSILSHFKYDTLTCAIVCVPINHRRLSVDKVQH